MDAAEGSYGQLLDHFGSKPLVDQALLRNRIIFITHMHGDHILGILKVLKERDLLLDKMPEERRNKIYVVTPSPILEWINHYLKESIIHLDLIEIIPTHHLNPEEFYYY